MLHAGEVKLIRKVLLELYDWVSEEDVPKFKAMLIDAIYHTSEMMEETTDLQMSADSSHASIATVRLQ